MKKLLVVDLLAEREGFGKHGTAEIVSHFPDYEIFLWAPHTTKALDYGWGVRVDSAIDADAIIITGSRKNVSQWEDWMDQVADLIRTADVPIYGICFGHQIIAASLGGKVVRAENNSNFLADVNYDDGTLVKQLFTHQDHVIDAGEMQVIASSQHCAIVACQHPTRPIKSVQFHPEAVHSVMHESIL
ncbi:MAG: gamma-glutamyl-gamma-aminobutyrate hydrolase family protein, partial [Candidatus Poseidoniaceae archaeon]|nr:gamma-glutamyl-gamma-aminobutyrate hydrolase family protein [Candidatus Poseidoniaceae archaeon]